MPDTNASKRKAENPKGSDSKRSKGGSGGKWRTPHQLAKMNGARGGGRIEPGDAGIWATCARGQEGRATVELKSMLQECAERFYGLTSEPDSGKESDGDEEDDEVDIEKSIQQEVKSVKEGKTPGDSLFSPIYLDIQCVLFFKTRPLIDPVEFVHRICEEIIQTPGIRRLRYVNRLSPMTQMGKATERGLEEIGDKVLGAHFQMAAASQGKAEKGHVSHATGGVKEGPGSQWPSYAIRPTIRNHKTLKRDAVIKQIASLVGDEHNVDLTKPDKVIIVEIYQTICGIGVVGSDWEKLKRYNLAELYLPIEARPPPVAVSAKA